jgi:uncharacterized damage-inducible protein DinB
MPGPRVEALIAKLEKGGRKTYEVLSELAPAQWRQVVYAEPYPWSVRDVLAHFVSSEGWLQRLAQDVASGGAGAPEGLDYNAVNAQDYKRLADRSPQELLEALVAARQATLDWVRTLEEADLDRMGRHPSLGQVSLETMLTAIYGHQLLHMRDAQRAMS